MMSNRAVNSGPEGKRTSGKWPDALVDGRLAKDPFLQQLEAETARCRLLEQKLQSQLVGLPAGSLCFKTINEKMRPYQQFYREGQRYQKSISGQETLLAELTQRRLVERLLPILQNNIRALDKCREIYWPWDLDAVIARMPESYRGLPHNGPELVGRPDVEKWMAEPTEKNPLYPEHAIINTQRGDKVRSKDEAIIADLLFLAGIPYKYDVLLLLDGGKYYPDFTIMHPRTGKIFYWEHFGRTHDDEYMEKAERKLKVYKRNNILPWNNLIVTYDTAGGVLDLQQVNHIIEVYFK